MDVGMGVGFLDSFGNGGHSKLKVPHFQQDNCTHRAQTSARAEENPSNLFTNKLTTYLANRWTDANDYRGKY